MDESAFTAGFCDFIRTCVPSFEAAATLVCMLGDRTRGWNAAAIAEELRSSVSITVAEAEKCLELFQARGLTAPDDSKSSRIRPLDAMETHLRTLTEAYRERPVTLVQLIYALRDDKIRSFSDAFRLSGK